MTLTQMRYYSTVCKTMNVTKAAQELHISQPTLSAAIRAMETECGVELFHHRANSLSISDEGLVLLEEITPMLENYDRLNRIIEDHMLDRKFVRLSFSTISGSEVCPVLCRQFRELYPDIQVLSSEGSTEKHYEDLENGKVDLVLTSKSRVIPDDMWENHYGHVRIPNNSQLVFCVSAEHPYAKKDSISWEEIAAVPLILLAEPFSVGKQMVKNMTEAGFPPKYAIQYTSQLFTVERFIESNAACGFLPRTAAFNNPEIVPIERPDHHSSGVYLSWIKEKPQFSSVKNFIKTARMLYPEGKKK